MDGEELLEWDREDKNLGSRGRAVTGADRQNKKSAVEDVDGDYFNSGSSSKMLSAGDSMRMGLVRFCDHLGLEKDGLGRWSAESGSGR